MNLKLGYLFEVLKKRRSIIISLIILLNIAFDQFSKFLIRNKIINGDTIHIIKDFLIFKKVENTGAALGLGRNLPSLLKTFYLQFLPLLVLLFFYRLIITKTQISKFTVIGLALAIGGAVGNIIDRILIGSVTDFIQINTGLFTTGIFNTADISIVVGALLVLFELSFNKENNLLDSI